MIILSLLMLSGVVACKKKPAKPAVSPTLPPPKTENAEPALAFLDIMAAKCAGCHVSGGYAGNSDFRQLKTHEDWAASRYIVPGKPLASPLYYRLQNSKADGSPSSKDMPLAAPALSTRELEVIESFIVNSQKSSRTLQAFNTYSDDINVLPFKFRMLKLAYLRDDDPEVFAAASYAKRFYELRYVLGDYYYAGSIVEQRVWGSMQMDAWRQGLSEYCAHETMTTAYPWRTGMDTFVMKAFGRALLSEEKSALDGIDKLEVDAKEKFTIACVTLLSSLEFQTQARPAKALDAAAYLERLAGMLVQRPFTSSEREQVNKDQEGVIASLVASWISSPRFLHAVRSYTDKLLGTSGQERGIDFNLPGNLAVELERRREAYAKILTANYCVDGAGKTISCDTNAPFAAGVLTTRAFLVGNRGPYNLARANRLLNSFACKTYPLPQAMEPPLAMDAMIPTFATTSGEGFGNGSNCYLCHSQFGRHAQFFVKFDAEGLYQAKATGLQHANPNVTGGHSDDHLYTSHMIAPDKAADESSAFFGQASANLQEAAQKLVKDPSFVQCTIKNVMSYFLRLKDTTVFDIRDELIADISQRILAKSPDPTFGQIVEQTLIHPQVVESFSKTK